MTDANRPADAPRRSLWSRIGWIGFLICGALLIQNYLAKETYFSTSGGVEERFHSGEKYANDKVAVVALSGVIASGDGYVKRQIDLIREDPDVKAIVLRIDSPGGTVYGSDYIYHHLTKLRDERKLPIVVSMGSVAASGGYYVSMAVGEQDESIFAEPTTVTGSIGVIIPHYDVSGLMQRFDVRNDSIASHERKQMLSMTRSMPDEHRQIVQAQVDSMFDRFKRIIYAGRPNLRNDDSTLMHNDRDLATGEVFTGEQAVEFGLVDRIGFIEDAIDRAIELAKLTKKDVRVVRFENPTSLLPIALMRSETSDQSELAALIELSKPKAYYLTPGYLPLGRSEN